MPGTDGYLQVSSIVQAGYPPNFSFIRKRCLIRLRSNDDVKLKESVRLEGELHFAYGHVADNKLSNLFHYGNSAPKEWTGRDDECKHHGATNSLERADGGMS
jgi:hypothetical protein